MQQAKNLSAAARAFAGFAAAAGDAFLRCPLPIAAVIAAAYRAAAESAAPDFCAPPPGEAAGAELRAGIAALFAAPPADAHPLFAAAARMTLLPWRAAVGGRLPALGVAELIGPQGVVKNGDCRAGLFYQPPELFYDRHCHPAEEIYMPLAGDAVWYADGRAAVTPAPGGVVYHPSMLPHAMRSRAAPLLALWGWRGDIDMNAHAMCAPPPHK